MGKAQKVNGHDGHDGHDGHGPLHPEKQITMESFLFDEPWNEIRRERLDRFTNKLKARVYAFRFVMDIIIGYAIGVLAVAIHGFTHWMSHARVAMALEASSEAQGWAINTGLMVCILLPALLGVIWQPAAGSSGVPGVVAYLNGCNLPSTLTPKVWMVKVVGLCCAVASGLPAGSEGPMAHIGAMTALMVVRYAIAPLFRSYAEWIDDTETDVYAKLGLEPQDKQSIARSIFCLSRVRPPCRDRWMSATTRPSARGAACRRRSRRRSQRRC